MKMGFDKCREAIRTDINSRKDLIPYEGVNVLAKESHSLLLTTRKSEVLGSDLMEHQHLKVEPLRRTRSDHLRGI